MSQRQIVKILVLVSDKYTLNDPTTKYMTSASSYELHKEDGVLCCYMIILNKLQCIFLITLIQIVFICSRFRIWSIFNELFLTCRVSFTKLFPPFPARKLKKHFSNGHFYQNVGIFTWIPSTHYWMTNASVAHLLPKCYFSTLLCRDIQ